ncbi:MAG: murein biosynthesis integral membrane protein MurJ [Deltaproteobacteria bacterium]|nr:murein biosynthesis integral membrane protein MurJ [Deltaproteobacteria bacterium]
MQEKEAKDVRRGAGIIAAFTLLSRIAGFVRDQVVIHLFGASRNTDVFWMAFTIPNVMRRLVAEGSLTVAFIPVYTKVKETEGDEEAKRFLAHTMGLIAFGVLGICALGALGAEWLVLAFASGFRDDPASFELCVSLTRWLFPYVYFISFVALAMGVLNAHKRFAAPAAAPILLNVSIVGCALLTKQYFDPQIYVLAAGVLLGGAAQFLLQIPALKSAGLLVRPRISLSSPHVKHLLRLMLPALFGLAVYQLNIIVLRQFASYLPQGHITYYYNADRLIQFAYGVFAVAISAASLPVLSEHFTKGRIQAMIDAWKFSTKTTNFVTIPAACGLFAIATPIVSLGYLHGKFTFADVQLTAFTTMSFAPGLIALGAVRSTIQLFYAAHDTRTPVIASTMTLASVLVLGWLLLPHEVVGLGLALTLSTWIQLVVLLSLLKRRLRNPTTIHGLPGAQIFVDGKDTHQLAADEEQENAGQATLTGLNVGTHELRFVLKDQEETATFEVTEEGAASLNLGFAALLAHALIRFTLAVVACGGAYYVSTFGEWEAGPTLKNAVLLVVSMGIAIGVYGGVSLVARFEEVAPIRNKIMRKLGR